MRKPHKERVSTSEYNRAPWDQSGDKNPRRIQAERAKLVPAFASLRMLSPTVGDNALHHAWTLIEAFTQLFGLVAAIYKFRSMRNASQLRQLHTDEFPCPSYTKPGYAKAVYAAVKEVLDDMESGEVAIDVIDENTATAPAVVDPDFPALNVGELT